MTNISGIGIITNYGRGIQSFNQALNDESVCLNDFHISNDVLVDKTVLANMRRCDRFTKLATLACVDAYNDSQISLGAESRELGIILSTSFGPHATTFKFLDDILNFGDKSVSPITFSHSVHNASVSYISQVLNMRGPTITITNFFFAFQEALVIANSWLNELRCKYVLVGAVDELGSVFENIANQKLAKENKKINLGEAAVFFLLTKEDLNNKYCQLDMVCNNFLENSKKSDMAFIDDDGLNLKPDSYKSIVQNYQQVLNYSNKFGSMMNLSAVHAAVAALKIKNENVDSIDCVRVDCLGSKYTVVLKNRGLNG